MHEHARMAGDEPGPILFENSVLRGSRLLGLVLTGTSDQAFRQTLSRLIAPHGEVTIDDGLWMPRGTVLPQRSQLARSDGLLPAQAVAELGRWWTDRLGLAHAPAWDLACVARIGGRRGLVLAEAKAHTNELRREGLPTRNELHREAIRAALREPARRLNRIHPGWRLHEHTRFALVSRIAWACKIASLGVPVVLLYLGFLDVTGPSGQGEPFRSPDAWNEAVRNYAEGIVPAAAWNTPLFVNDTPLIPLIRSLRLEWPVEAG